MPKNIVICCDGTGNEIGETLSNVLKLYRILRKSPDQRVYYNPGVGTIGYENAWQRFKQRAKGFFGLATGYGLDRDVLSTYRFLSETYQPGDRIWLFGFSRGAYTVRVLAAFTHVIGLLPPDQINLAPYAFTAFKRANAKPNRTDDQGENASSDALQAAWGFGRVAGGVPIRIEFIGVWDTVASVIVPRSGTLFPSLRTLRFTRTNPSVGIFRQAIALDERRRMFRLNRWIEPQPFRAEPYSRDSLSQQDIKQVWFAGVHADIGGGYPEREAGLSKFPLRWMVREAFERGLEIDQDLFDHLANGADLPGSCSVYVPPDVCGRLHDSMSLAWRILEWVPKKARWREWPSKLCFAGWYLPTCEPRVVPHGALVHWSVLARAARVPSYRPVNLQIADVTQEDMG